MGLTLTLALVLAQTVTLSLQDANGQMENSEGQKMIYGTKELVQYIDGAKALAGQLEAGAKVTPAEGAAEGAPSTAEAAPTENPA